MQNFRKNHLNVANLAMIAVLLAAEVILSRFLSISLPLAKIGFAFIPIAIAARKMGAAEAAIVAGLGDLLGALLFPIGAYFPGFTITAVLTALSTATFFRKNVSLPLIVGSVLVKEVFGSIALNTLWLSMLMSTPYLIILPTRLIQATIMAVVQIFVLWLLFLKSGKFFGKVQAK